MIVAIWLLILLYTCSIDRKIFLDFSRENTINYFRISKSWEEFAWHESLQTGSNPLYWCWFKYARATAWPMTLTSVKILWLTIHLRLCMLVYSIAPQITMLFNKSMSGKLPSWKLSSVVPVPKVANYRPISLLLNISKLLERHMTRTG